ncbi:MAG: hypothetical protein WBM86_00285 [Waterburya sp.]
MKLLNIVHGQKGGVGKSTWTKILLEYYISKKWQYKLFDLDAGSLDVGCIYDPNRYQKNTAKKQQIAENKVQNNEQYFLQFTDNKNSKDDVDIIFEAATKQNVIVNLPSNIKHLYYPWIKDNDLINLAKEVKMTIIQWFVSSGEPNSITEFLETIDSFTNCDNFKHIFVKNYGEEENWAKVLEQNKNLRETLEADKIITVDFPEFSPSRFKIIVENNLTFAAAKDSDKLNIIAKSALSQWLNKCAMELDAVFEELKVLKPVAEKK